MTPAEVIAMRNRLVEELEVDFTIYDGMGDFNWIADWLIEKGWVVAPPKNEGETR